MSKTFSLVCHETKQMIWVGQGSDTMTNFYGGQPGVMKRLGRFLEATRGKALILICNDTEGVWLEEYEEFEDPDPDGT